MGWSGQWRVVEPVFLDKTLPSFSLAVGVSPLQLLPSRLDGSLAMWCRVWIILVFTFFLIGYHGKIRIDSFHGDYL